MSDALNYLMQVRPGAMESYFDFIRKAGTHLDNRTRALISVITKVDNQTETGFRQYLVRALQAGNTANQIIDALLVAFPTLGLSKIIWAIDIILTMDIPEFRPEALQAQTSWHSVMALNDISEGVSKNTCDGRELIIYRNGDEVTVYDSHCPHQATDIPVISVSQDTLTCPKHGWKFNVASGACVDKGNRPLRQFDAKIEKGVLVALF
jgi:nitrite reductase/ring-hydroxylating ferredoxin subunit/alkylhydroperoxidase/carboxymuconolactone decarboxylase family protein YurZ